MVYVECWVFLFELQKHRTTRIQDDILKSEGKKDL
jgi:hypothetical protein